VINTVVNTSSVILLLFEFVDGELHLCMCKFRAIIVYGRIGPLDLFEAMTSVSKQSRIFRVVIFTILPLVPPGGVLDYSVAER